MQKINLNETTTGDLNPNDQHRHDTLARLLGQPEALYHDRRGDHLIRFLHTGEAAARLIVDVCGAGHEDVMEPMRRGIAIVNDRYVAVTMIDESAIGSVLVPVELKETYWPEPVTGLMRLTTRHGIVVDAEFVCDGVVPTSGIVVELDSPATHRWREALELSAGS